MTHVERACRMLRAELGARGEARDTLEVDVVSVHVRTQSTIHVLRVRDARGRGEGRFPERYYLKTVRLNGATHAVRRGEVENEYRVLGDVAKWFQGFAEFEVIEPVACLPDDLALITQECPGDKLDSVLARLWLFQGEPERQAIEQLCHRVGQWLRLFQAATSCADDRWDRAELLQYVDDRLRILVDRPISGVTSSEARRFLWDAEHQAAAVDADQLSLTGRQNDFRPDNMLVRSGRIAVLDFTGFRGGPALYDFMKFWMRLEYYAFGPLNSSRLMNRMKAAFAEGYGRPVNLASPLAQLLRQANLLDKMSELVEEESARPWRRILDRWWYQHLRRQFRCAGPHGAGG